MRESLQSGPTLPWERSQILCMHQSVPLKCWCGWSEAWCGFGLGGWHWASYSPFLNLSFSIHSKRLRLVVTQSSPKDLVKIWSDELLQVSWRKALIKYSHLTHCRVAHYMIILVFNCRSCNISVSEPCLDSLLKRDHPSLFNVRGWLAIFSRLDFQM